MKAIYQKRLLKLADVLMKFKAERKRLLCLPTDGKLDEFDMESWGTITSCGTSACALGTAALIPSFHRSGLTMKVDPNIGLLWDNGSFIKGMKIRFKSYEATQAGEKFFGLTHMEARWLFEDRYITAKNVAHRIRAMVKFNQKYPDWENKQVADLHPLNRPRKCYGYPY